MRLLAIGDIHGCSRALNALLDVVSPASHDVIVALGDYVDWGPDSRGVLDRLLDQRTRCNLVALRGNHEEMMLRSRLNADEHAFWLRAGGDVTIRSYLDGVIPESHWNFIEHECRDSYETDSHIFVHGGLSPDVPLQEQPAYMLRWEDVRGRAAALFRESRRLRPHDPTERQAAVARPLDLHRHRRLA